jgi:REP element-mobilizing transposase RayT
MTNHVHLLISPLLPEGVSRVMCDLGRDFVRTINRTCSRTGTLWNGRFKSSLVDSSRYCLTCYRYAVDQFATIKESSHAPEKPDIFASQLLIF